MLLLSLIYLFIASVSLWLILHIFQIKQFKWCVTNVWTIMHLDTHKLKPYVPYDSNTKELVFEFQGGKIKGRTSET